MTRPGATPPRGRHAAPDGGARPESGGRHAAADGSADPPRSRHAAAESPRRRHAAEEDDAARYGGSAAVNGHPWREANGYHLERPAPPAVNGYHLDEPVPPVTGFPYAPPPAATPWPVNGHGIDAAELLATSWPANGLGVPTDPPSRNGHGRADPRPPPHGYPPDGSPTSGYAPPDAANGDAPPGAAHGYPARADYAADRHPAPGDYAPSGYAAGGDHAPSGYAAGGDHAPSGYAAGGDHVANDYAAGGDHAPSDYAAGDHAANGHPGRGDHAADRDDGRDDGRGATSPDGYTRPGRHADGYPAPGRHADGYAAPGRHADGYAPGGSYGANGYAGGAPTVGGHLAGGAPAREPVEPEPAPLAGWYREPFRPAYPPLSPVPAPLIGPAPAPPSADRGPAAPSTDFERLADPVPAAAPGARSYRAPSASPAPAPLPVVPPPMVQPAGPPVEDPAIAVVPLEDEATETLDRPDTIRPARPERPERPERKGKPDDPSHPPRAVVRRRRARRKALEWPFLIAFALVSAFLIRAYVVQTFFIPSASMHETLVEGDRVLVNKVGYHLHGVHRGDVVVFRKPPNIHVDEDDLIKRVVGLPGESVEGRGGEVYVNGAPLSEPYVEPLCHGTSDFTKVTVPAGKLWVMGDNRCNSSDSRVFGPIAQNLLIGRAFVLAWPVGRLSWL